MNEARTNPVALAAAQPRQVPPHIPLGDGLGLYGVALMPVVSVGTDDGGTETIRVILCADVGRVSILTQRIEVQRVILGDFGTTTKDELRAKYEAASKPKEAQDG
jgi:hypothetical protein